jgi:hypothetical protein
VKTWIERLNELAAGMLFNGGYVAATGHRPDRHRGECREPDLAAEASGKDESGRRLPWPATRLVLD